MSEESPGPAIDQGDVAITRIAAANTIRRIREENVQLVEHLHALAAKWDQTAGRNQRNGRSLVGQGGEYGNEGLAIAEALGDCVVQLRALLADYETDAHAADVIDEDHFPGDNDPEEFP